MAQQTESMEAILTSIRSGVEGAANGGGDVVELAPDDIVEDAAGTNGHAVDVPDGDELIDINAFAMGGEEKPAENVTAGADLLGENDVLPEAAAAVEDVPAAAAPVVAPVASVDDSKKAAAEDEFDKLLAELGSEEKAAVPEPVVASDPTLAPVEPEPVVEEVVPAEEAVAVEPIKAAPVEIAVPANGARMVLPALEGVGGLQVAFPAEVLAAALRPMVKDWVAENLPAIVERLVKEEIGKLTQE